MGPLVEKIPDGPPYAADFIFHAGSVPPPPPLITTDRILMRKSSHHYNGWFRAESLWLFLSPQTCRQLGALLMTCYFHGPQTDVTLSLTRPDSDIRRIIVRARELTLDDPPVGLSHVPFAFRYYPSETRKHPFIDDRHVYDLPLLALSDADDCVGARPEDWENRDTIWLSPDTGTARLAELLLNAGCSWNPVREYQLEGDAGFRSLAPMSAELRIFLPGSDAWWFQPEDDLPAAPLQW